jgi:hypothetical protein
LINLNVIAEKAREEKLRKAELTNDQRDEYKLRPIPFYIDWLVKEDLNIVLKNLRKISSKTAEISELDMKKP